MHNKIFFIERTAKLLKEPIDKELAWYHYFLNIFKTNTFVRCVSRNLIFESNFLQYYDINARKFIDMFESKGQQCEVIINEIEKSKCKIS